MDSTIKLIPVHAPHNFISWAYIYISTKVTTLASCYIKMQIKQII